VCSFGFTMGDEFPSEMFGYFVGYAVSECGLFLSFRAAEI
jgi:hypothetical protein